MIGLIQQGNRSSCSCEVYSIYISPFRKKTLRFVNEHALLIRNIILYHHYITNALAKNPSETDMKKSLKGRVFKGRFSVRQKQFILEELLPIIKSYHIPQGIPGMPFARQNYFKDKFCVTGKYMLLTFGMLSSNKGIEYVSRAQKS